MNPTGATGCHPVIPMLASPLSLSAMLSHFHSADSAPALLEPVATIFPEIAGADIAAVFVGKRVGADF